MRHVLESIAACMLACIAIGVLFFLFAAIQCGVAKVGGLFASIAYTFALFGPGLLVGAFLLSIGKRKR